MTETPFSGPPAPASPHPPPASGRLTLGQTVAWAVAFLAVAALIALFFVFDTAARPLFGAALDAAPWLPS